MRFRNVILATILLSAAVTVNASTAQQDKMKSCNAEAKTQALSGDARKSFMKTCLSNAPAAAPASSKALTAQQEKMKTCSTDAKAKALKGADRKAFMKTCLSGD
jgi:psiF repeat